MSSDDSRVYRQSWSEDFSKRFDDILSPEVTRRVVNLFANSETADLQVQEESVGLSSNEMLKAHYNDRRTPHRISAPIGRVHLGSWTVVNKSSIAFLYFYV